MTTLERAAQAISALHGLTRGLKEGRAPDLYGVAYVASELFKLELDMGIEMSEMFGEAENAEQKRKEYVAERHSYHRRELNKTAADSAQDALIEASDEYNKEIQSAEMYKKYQAVLSAVKDNAQWARSLVSLFRDTEKS